MSAGPAWIVQRFPAQHAPSRRGFAVTAARAFHCSVRSITSDSCPPESWIRISGAPPAEKCFTFGLWQAGAQARCFPQNVPGDTMRGKWE
jgi:hypothetical protein